MTFYQDLSSRNKRLAAGLFLLLLVGLVLSSFAFAVNYLLGAKSEWRQAQSFYPAKQISVGGKGEKSVKPDIAVISFAVVTEGKKLKEVQDENSQKFSAAISFLKEKGVEEKDLRTAFYIITPQYQYFENPPCYASPCPPRRPPEIVSYTIKNRVNAKVRDLNKVDEILEGIVVKGVNDVDNVQFKIGDEDAVLAEVRKMAIADAKIKAEKLAKDLGVRIGKIISFQDGGGPVQPLYQDAYSLGGESLKAAAAPSIQPGEQEIKSTVTITYELR